MKVLDLGLATALPGADRDGASNAADSPTLTMGATESGVIMGTAAYMSPEQASGRRVDKRADIWSYGVVLWEMLTGRRLFPGGKWKISNGLAGPSFWSQKRPQLFYYQGGSVQQIWVATYKVKGDSFIANQPQAWAKSEQADMADLMPDGKRFIAVLPAEAAKSDRNTHLTFLLNFADELNRRASDRK